MCWCFLLTNEELVEVDDVIVGFPVLVSQAREYADNPDLTRSNFDLEEQSADPISREDTGGKFVRLAKATTTFCKGL